MARFVTFLSLFVLVLGVECQNGYYGGGGNGGNNQINPNNTPQQEEISSLPQYDQQSPQQNQNQNQNPQQQQDYWWLNENPFQKPAGHPGVERTDGKQPQFGQKTIQKQPQPQQQQQQQYSGGSGGPGSPGSPNIDIRLGPNGNSANFNLNPNPNVNINANTDDSDCKLLRREDCNPQTQVQQSGGQVSSRLTPNPGQNVPNMGWNMPNNVQNPIQNPPNQQQTWQQQPQEQQYVAPTTVSNTNQNQNQNQPIKQQRVEASTYPASGNQITTTSNVPISANSANNNPENNPNNPNSPKNPNPHANDPYFANPTLTPQPQIQIQPQSNIQIPIVPQTNAKFVQQNSQPKNANFYAGASGGQGQQGTYMRPRPTNSGGQQQQQQQPWKNQQQNQQNQNFVEPPPYPGCPAAMLCVDDNLCNPEGVIQERALQLSDAEKLYRVALMACSEPSTGIVGVCCRDPNYVDPWPDMNGNGNGNGNGMKKMMKSMNFQPSNSGGSNPGNFGGNYQRPPPSAPIANNAISGGGGGGWNPPGQNNRAPNSRAISQGNVQQQQYQPQQQQQQMYQQPQQQQQQQYQPQPSNNIGNYAATEKPLKDSGNPFVVCRLGFECVDSKICSNGIIQENLNSAGGISLAIDVRFNRKQRKCRGDSLDTEWICCKRQENSKNVKNFIINPQHLPWIPQAFTSTQSTPTSEINFLSLESKPFKTNNGIKESQFESSKLITGDGLPFHHRLRNTFRLNNYNPYSESNPPFIFLHPNYEDDGVFDQQDIFQKPQDKIEDIIDINFDENDNDSKIPELFIRSAKSTGTGEEISEPLPSENLNLENDPKVTEPEQSVIELEEPEVGNFENLESTTSTSTTAVSTTEQPETTTNFQVTEGTTYTIEENSPDYEDLQLNIESQVVTEPFLNSTENPVTETTTVFELETTTNVPNILTQSSENLTETDTETDNDDLILNKPDQLIYKGIPTPSAEFLAPSVEYQESRQKRRLPNPQLPNLFYSPFTQLVPPPLPLKIPSREFEIPPLPPFVEIESIEIEKTEVEHLNSSNLPLDKIPDEIETIQVTTTTVETPTDEHVENSQNPQNSENSQISENPQNSEESEEESSDEVPEDSEEDDELPEGAADFGVRLFSPRIGEKKPPVVAVPAPAPEGGRFVPVCPGGMKCLRENYCQPPNPHEGTINDFDVRIENKRKPIQPRLRCKQRSLPVEGVCCFLREDFKNVTPSETPDSMVPLLSERRQKLRNESRIDVCGIRKIPPDEKDDQVTTTFGQFPWQALVSVNRSPSTIDRCGGVILSRRVIVTSAACVHNVGSKQITVRVGEWDIGSDEEKAAHADHLIEIAITHPLFRLSNLSHDIALLFTRERIQFGYNVARICLPQPVANFVGKKCLATGWGTLKRSQTPGSFVHRQMRQVVLPIVPQQYCEQQLRKTSLGPFYRLNRDILCAGGEPNRDLCTGDQGGPLVCEQINGDYTLAGISSWALGCGGSNIPAVFTSVPSHAEWIYEHLKQIPENVINKFKFAQRLKF